MQAYDAAAAEIERRYREAEQSEPEVDYARYVWWYDRTDVGDFIARDPAAPAWTWEAWRAQSSREGVQEEHLDVVEESLRTGVGLFTGRPGDAASAYIVKSPEAAAELWRLEDERDDKMTVFGDLEERLEQQRIREWTAYGEALKTRIEAVARSTPGLQVSVNVTVDAQTFRRLEHQQADARFFNSLESRLVDAALLDTPTPADLPGTPLERLERS